MSDTVYQLEFAQESHQCPNADVLACEFCKLLNYLQIVSRTFKLKNAEGTWNLLEECSVHVQALRHLVDKLTPHLSRFDFDEIVQANGYRTFLAIAWTGVTKCLYLVNELSDISSNYSPQTHPHLAEKLLDWSRIFRVLAIIMDCLVEFVESSSSDSLFTSSEPALKRSMSMTKERDNLVGFHGRLLGFQFCKSVRGQLRFVSTLMGAHSEVYKTESVLSSSLLSSKAFLIYMRSPCSRAERIAKMAQEDPLDFFKSFWLLLDKGLVRMLCNCIGEPVESNLEISVPPTRLTVKCSKNAGSQSITILPPSEYIGIKPIMLRLVSHKKRSGSVGSGPGPAAELSKTLIVHCHGGGFVAQSSNSHLIYLKSWAKGVGAPIVSVDYSLAPEAPYPRALHEVFYAYLWALQHAHLLGSTADKVILAGDSAGGLLLTGVTLLCIELGVRLPDGLLIAYTPQLLETAVSPARLLSLADPLLPYPALAACLHAYLGSTFDPAYANIPGSFVEGPYEPELDNSENCSRKFTILKGLEEVEGVNWPEDDWHLSPLIAPDALLKKFPPTSVVTAALDPCMDDCVEFAKRLKSNGVPVTLDVFNSLPHGFLNFGRVSEECYHGIETCYRRLKNFVVM